MRSAGIASGPIARIFSMAFSRASNRSSPSSGMSAAASADGFEASSARIASVERSTPLIFQ